MNNTYTVRPGDTLYGISKQLGVSVQDLKAANDLEDNIVVLGSTLTIPSTNPLVYVVEKGDNLYSIAKNFGISVDSLMNANNLTNTDLSIGQVLTIPASGSSSNYITYTVKKGDDLYSLAKRYKTTVNAIKEINHKVNNNLSIGEVLKIPTVLVDETDSNNTVYNEYVVKRGDNLYSIADKFNISVDDIKKINNLKGNALTIGQTLIIESYPEDGEILECYGNSGDEYITYIVKDGDDLYSVARRYNTSVQKIKELNNLTSDDLSIGQILQVKEAS